jgi:hypothetical protein
MPIGAQSLQSYIATIYTSMVASTYKANIDGNSSIVSNAAGALYVYPNNPVALNVLVDPAFNVPQLAAADPYVLNGAASPVTVTLVAPGSNSYYACIYWDIQSAVAGVVYGASAVSPLRVLPDPIRQVPLAFVLLTTGQATVTAANISDARSLLSVGYGTLTTALGSVSTAQSVNCDGASSVNITLQITAAITLTLTNVRYGCEVGVICGNASGGALILKIAASTPSGVAIAINGKISGSASGFANLTATGSSIGAGLSYIFYGRANSTAVAINMMIS